MSRDQASAAVMVGVVASFALVFAVVGCERAEAKPCAKHRGPERRDCLRQLKRDRIAYPPSVTWSEALARTTPHERRVMLSIAHCEMGAQSRPAKRQSIAHPPPRSRWSTVRWGLSYSKYSTGFGVWNGNFPEIRRITGYSLPGTSPAEELLGVVALARRYGFSAWACYGK